MKKSIVMLLGLALISAISMAMISPAKADVGILSWRPIYVSKDSDTVIYEDGATASCIVGVTNSIASGFVMNVSKVTLEFYQIGINKTLDLSATPHQLKYNQVELFTVSFTAHGSEFFSGQTFECNLIIEWVNATTGPIRVVGSWDLQPWFTGLQALEVYTVAQQDIDDALTKYYTYYNEYFFYDWQSTLAEQKVTQATIEKTIGDTYSQGGDYASAVVHYNSSNILWEEALTAEFNWRNAREDADLNVTLTNATATLIVANAAKAQADAAITNAYGWYFVGIGFAIGWSLMGVGVIIWAWRRPKPPV